MSIFVGSGYRDARDCPPGDEVCLLEEDLRECKAENSALRKTLSVALVSADVPTGPPAKPKAKPNMGYTTAHRPAGPR